MGIETRDISICVLPREKKKYKITRLRREDGAVVSEEKEIKEAVTTYFTNLLFSTVGTSI